jgi:hypothetical protein
MVASCSYSGCHSSTYSAYGINLEGYAALKSFISVTANNKLRFLGCMKQTGTYLKMPKNSNPLSTCKITQIEAWINQGMLNN